MAGVRQRLRFPCSLIEHGKTHEKVLIVDHEFMVVTSFNWLSFRGEWGQREEAGIYHRIRSEIDDAAEVYLERLGLRAEAVAAETSQASVPAPVSAEQRQQLENRGMRVRDRARDRDRDRKRR
jgi:hypothetical protein